MEIPNPHSRTVSNPHSPCLNPAQPLVSPPAGASDRVHPSTARQASHRIQTGSSACYSRSRSRSSPPVCPRHRALCCDLEAVCFVVAPRTNHIILWAELAIAGCSLSPALAPPRSPAEVRMERPVPSPALGPRSATATPSSASTICVSSRHHQPDYPQPQQPNSTSGPILRRGRRRAARGITVAAADESRSVWGPTAAKPGAAGSSSTSSGSSPGLGTSEDRDSSTASPATTAGPPKKKQKRNKPTLSCFECVERKTKVSLQFLDYVSVK